MQKILLTVALLIGVTRLDAQTSVWKAQKGDSVTYVGATCHLLRPQDFPLPPQFNEAFKASQVLVFETDLGQMELPAVQQRLITRSAYPDGSSIEKHLSPKVYAQLKAYCEGKGIPMAVLEKMKASMLMVSLGTMELLQMGVGQTGVDKFLYDLARKEKKTIQALESIDEQIGFLVSIADGKEDEYVSQSLQEMKEVKQQYAAILEAWRQGTAEKLDQLVNDKMRKTPELYAKLISGRNKAWWPAIEACQSTPETEFILVGAAHVVGADGILATLKSRGYKVEQLP